MPCPLGRIKFHTLLLSAEFAQILEGTGVNRKCIELKWNKSSGGALRQIKERNYSAVLEDYGGETVLAGINYDSAKKEHCCVIERCRGAFCIRKASRRIFSEKPG